MNFESLSSEPRRRFPLYAGLAAGLCGCAFSAALTLLGSLWVQNEALHNLQDLRRSCAAPAAAQACAAARGAQARLIEHGSVVLLMQTLCLLLIVAGTILILGHARRWLVRSTSEALDAASAPHPPSGSNEIEQLISALARMGARVAGIEAEDRWGRQLLSEGRERVAGVVGALNEITRLLGADDASEFNLLSGLSTLQHALGATTVGLSLSPRVRDALALPAVLHTNGEPRLAAHSTAEPVTKGASPRLVPAESEDERQTLVIPMVLGDAALGRLLAEFAPDVPIDAMRIQLAECAARLAALAVSGVARSQEERRIALLEERSAMASELHDSLAQSLAFMKIQVARLRSVAGKPDQVDAVLQASDELRAGLSTAYREVRDLIATFRVRMGPGGLLVAIQEAIEEFGQRSALEIEFDARLGRCRLEVNEEFHVLQVVREALSNTVRHAGAQHVWISAIFGDDGRLAICVDDDGRGPGTRRSPDGHYGIGIMSDRAHTLDGSLEIMPRPGGGTRVKLVFAPKRPIAATAAASPERSSSLHGAPR